MTIEIFDFGFLTNIPNTVFGLSMNSLRIPRMSILFLSSGLLYWFYSVKREKYYYFFIYGFIISISVIWSNDFGIMSGLVLSLIFFIKSINKKESIVLILKKKH